MPLPNLLLVGAQKAGTTSLYDWLSQHTEIEANTLNKEVPFFADDPFYEQGIDYYRDLFPARCDTRYLMAGSVQLMFFKQAIPRIQLHCPDCRIIAMVRNPIHRALSAYRFARQRGLEHRTFDQAIADELESITTGSKLYTGKTENFQKHYVARGLYGEQLDHITEHLGYDRVFAGLFEELKDNEDAFLRTVFDFLNLEYHEIEYKVLNQTEGAPRIRFLNQLFFSDGLRESRPVQALKHIIPHAGRVKLRRTLTRLLTGRSKEEPASMSAETESRLQQIFREDLQKSSYPRAQSWLSRWQLDV